MTLDPGCQTEFKNKWKLNFFLQCYYFVVVVVVVTLQAPQSESFALGFGGNESSAAK